MGFFRRLFGLQIPPPTGERQRLYPECLYTVTMSDDDVTFTDPERRSLSMRWDEVEEVGILTNSLGPLVADVFFVLKGPSFDMAVPQGATGDDKLVERLQELPGFDNQALIEAMCCTDDRVFKCWSRDTPAHS